MSASLDSLFAGDRYLVADDGTHCYPILRRGGKGPFYNVVLEDGQRLVDAMSSDHSRPYQWLISPTAATDAQMYGGSPEDSAELRQTAKLLAAQSATALGTVTEIATMPDIGRAGVEAGREANEQLEALRLAMVEVMRVASGEYLTDLVSSG